MAKNTLKKKSARNQSWLKILIALGVITVVVAYGVYRSGKVGYLKDFVKTYLQEQEMEAALYFGDPDSDNLRRELRTIPLILSPPQKIERIIEELIKGPRGTLIRTIPPRTTLNGVRINNKEAWLDFSSPLSLDHPGGSSAELMTVYSIVNTVVLNNRGIGKVWILIDGKKIETLAGHIDCSVPLVANREFIK